jgi:hypothetical protein
MENIVIWVLRHCTCYSWGWMTKHFDENLFNDPRALHAYIMINLSVIGIILFFNIFYFLLIKSGEYYSKIFIPLMVLYLIINTIFLSLLIYVISIFGLFSWAILGIISIILFIVGVFNKNEEHITTTFNLLASFLEYSQDYYDYSKNISEYKKNYKKFINGKIN